MSMNCKQNEIHSNKRVSENSLFMFTIKRALRVIKENPHRTAAGSAVIIKMFYTELLICFRQSEEGVYGKSVSFRSENGKIYSE